MAFEGELAIVIGRRCSAVPVEEAPDYVFGYTCANDVTVGEIIGRDPTFPSGCAPRASTPSARSAR
nr:fumarylacetoacetate hydrolase family protein [Massilia timonae]